MNIKELADNATHYANGICDADANADWYEVRDTKFAELVAAAEREACARLCDAVDAAHEGDCILAKWCAEAIRARSITVSKVCEADALPPTSNAVYWMDMVVTNLVRNGVNKHRARELAYHFYTYTTPRENNNG